MSIYELIKFSGLVIRQFCLPNPFESMWPEKAFVLNLLFGMLLLPIAYLLVGRWYERGDGAALGSFIFNAVYIILSLALWGFIMLLKIITENVIAFILIAVSVLIIATVIAVIVRRTKKKVNP